MAKGPLAARQPAGVKPQTFLRELNGTAGPVLANNGLPGHVPCMSAYPPTADIRWPMSGLGLISSASPPIADVPGGAVEGPVMTQAV